MIKTSKRSNQEKNLGEQTYSKRKRQRNTLMLQMHLEDKNYGVDNKTEYKTKQKWSNFRSSKLEKKKKTEVKDIAWRKQ